ncbi:hypothetical protein GSI_01579 [Ganoderma sinense ZZ0214-1]|uniref:F-box domain-containing protein n=1 Tax=Ganoderma sinense ZZ0214-1 TaxID=1077348 RepID=A0A2G8SQ68_9APHY|nr:hypothetical protein GSI_01579 [Ganoderma sinense ZZ0214-1]
MPRAKKARLSEPIPAPEASSGSTTSGATAAADHDGGQTKRALARRNIRGRRGGLKDMPNMPLDILIEIFGHMHPRDLLSLARTTKDFRTFLMSRDAAPFWKAARQQVEGLPECPEDLSEPAFANLVFFPYCHECLKPNVKSTLWEFLVRYCPSCKQTQITNDYYEIRTLADAVILTGQPYREFLNSVRAPATKGSRYKDDHYHRAEVKEFDAMWTSLSTDDEKKAFVEQRLEAVKKRKDHAKQMYQWQKRQEQNRSDELDVIREGRLEAIRKRLRDEGWAEELDLMDDMEEYELSRHKSARKSQKLTDYGWASIRDELHKHMENVRTKRLARERLVLTCTRLGRLRQALLEYNAARLPMSADMDWQPFFSDYAFMPTFKDLMEASADTEVTKDALFELCEAHLPTLQAQWRKDRKWDFAGIVVKGAGTFPGLDLPEDDDTLLSLAITTFDCKSCTYRGLRWPQVLAHRCVRQMSFLAFYFGETDRYRAAIARTCIEHKEQPPWPQDPTFGFNPSLESAVAAIRACGRDPATATADEMDGCGVRLLCRTCESPARRTFGISAFDWKSAARHGRNSLDIDLFLLMENRHNPEWVRLDAWHMEKVLQLETAKRERHNATPTGTTNFGCTKCRYRGAVDKFQEHCQKMHDVENPQLGADYYRHTDNAPSIFNPIKIYPEARRTDPTVVANVQAGNGFVATVLFPPRASSSQQ